MVLIFDANEGREVVIVDCVFWPGSHPFLSVVDTRIDHQKLSIYDCDFLRFVPSGELYVDGNGDSKCLGMKSECELISDLPINTFGSKWFLIAVNIIILTTIK